MRLIETNKWKTKPYADTTGVYVLIIRKSNNKTVSKIPYTTPSETNRDVINRIRELTEADKITAERIEKGKQLIRKTQATGSVIYQLLKKASRKKKTGKRRKKRAKKKKKKR